MAFFSGGKMCKKQTEGRVYVIRLVLRDGTEVHKVGMCHSPRSTDRMMEVLRSWFTAYRYVPYAELRLDKGTGIPRLLEKHMHELLSDLKWVPDKKVDGGQEMFVGVDEGALLDYLRNFDYAVLLRETTSIRSEDFDYIRSQINATEKLSELSDEIPY